MARVASGLAAVALGSLGIWLMLERGGAEGPEMGTAASSHALELAAPSEGARAPEGSEASKRALQGIASVASSEPIATERSAGRPSVAPERPRDDPDPAPGRPDHVIPHPMDPRRERMQAQLRVFSEVDRALRERRPESARALLEQHDRAFGDDEAWLDLREGYQLITDCMESDTATIRERARRFVNEERGSTLRRKVRRACLRER